MIRLIDADAFLETSIEEKLFFIHYNDAQNQQFVVRTIYDDLAQALILAHTIDAVPVVRCKVCVHRKGCKRTKALGINGYCSEGERA